MTEPTTIKIDDVEYVRKGTGTEHVGPVLGTCNYRVVRADSGVYCGELLSETSDGAGKLIVRLADGRRIWNWVGWSVDNPVHTVEDIAAKGVAPKSKVSAAVAEMTIADARVTLRCTAASEGVLRGVKWTP
jgi:hypothetical protein